MDRAFIVAWLEALDGLTYYALLGIPSDAGPDAIKLAFHAFADAFHPDAHAGRDLDEREAVGRIFRRGAEGYRVLEDPTLRAAYDASLASGEPPSVASRKSSLPPPRERPQGPKRLEDSLRSSTARPFARRAEELMKIGDWKQAKLQLSMAKNYEPDNEAIAQALADVEARIRSPK